MSTRAWLRPLSVPSLSGREIQLWKLDLSLYIDIEIHETNAHETNKQPRSDFSGRVTPDPTFGRDRWQSLLGLLPSAEQIQAERLSTNPSGRLEYVVSRALRRSVLAYHLAMATQKIEFARGQYGKPSVINHPCLHFSISHRKAWILLAVSQLGSIGADVEFVNTSAEARQRMAAWSRINGEHCPGGEACDARSFYQAWTRREALAKARGFGLGRPPSADCADANHACSVSAEEQASWTLHDLEMDEDYCGALAVPCSQVTIGLFDASALSILNA